MLTDFEGRDPRAARTLIGRLFSDDLRLATTLGLVARILNGVSRFVSVPLAIGLLSRDGYGLWLVITSLSAWLALADFGLPGALQNLLISLRTRKQFVEGKQLVWFSLRFFALLGGTAAVLGLVAAQVLPIGKWMNAPEALWSEFGWAFGGMIAVAGVLFFTRLGPALAYSHGFPSGPGLAEIFGTLASLGTLALICAFKWKSLVAMVLVTLAGQAVGAAFLTVWLLRRQGYLPLGRTDGRLDEHRRELFGKGKFFFLNVIGELLVFQSMAFLISIRLGPAAVPAYALPMIIFNNAIMLQAIALRTLVPRIRRDFEAGQAGSARKLALRAFAGCIGLGVVVTIGTILAGNWFMRVWTHGQVGISLTMATGVGAFLLIASLDNPCAQILVSLDGIRERCLLTFGFGFLQALFSFLLLPSLGVDFLPWISALTLFVAALGPGFFFLVRRFRSAPLAEAS